MTDLQNILDQITDIVYPDWRKPYKGFSVSELWIIRPIPATLDAIAGALPEGWRWSVWFPLQTREAVKAQAIKIGHATANAEASDDSQIEAAKLALARCALAAWQAEKGKA